jgi:hypothetical protein
MPSAIPRAHPSTYGDTHEMMRRRGTWDGVADAFVPSHRGTTIGDTARV